MKEKSFCVWLRTEKPEFLLPHDRNTRASDLRLDDAKVAMLDADTVLQYLETRTTWHKKGEATRRNSSKGSVDGHASGIRNIFKHRNMRVPELIDIRLAKFCAGIFIVLSLNYFHYFIFSFLCRICKSSC